MKRLLITLPSAALLSFALATLAFAHARIDRCQPAVGSTNNVAPTQVRCWFTEEIDPKQSTLTVTDASAQRVDNNDAQVDLNEKERKQLFVTLRPALPQGVYKVDWKVVTPDDAGTSEGDWYFGIGAVTVPQTGAIPNGALRPDSERTYLFVGGVFLATVAIALLARRVLR